MKTVKILLCSLLVVASIMLTGTEARAQFGVKAGLYSSHLSKLKDADLKLKNNLGWEAGVFYKLSASIITLQPEFLLVSKHHQVNDNTAGYHETYNQNYLMVPVGVQFGYNLIVARPYFQVVPYLSYAITKDYDNQDGWAGTNRFHTGVGIGGGVDVWKLQLSLKYNWDFGKMGSSSGGTSDLFNKFKNAKGGGFEFSVGITL